VADFTSLGPTSIDTQVPARPVVSRERDLG
jgi:hypothetical protein